MLLFLFRAKQQFKNIFHKISGLKSTDCFLLLRQNISLAQIFDLALISFVLAFFLGRFFFIINTLQFELIHAIKFFHLIKFPGLSSLGFFLGGSIALFLLFRKRKGIARIYDIFVISFLPVYSFNIIFRDYSEIYIKILLVLLSILIIYFFLRSHYKYIFHDGSIALIFLLLISIDSFIYQLLTSQKQSIFLSLSFIQILSVPLIFVFGIWFLINQKKH